MTERTDTAPHGPHPELVIVPTGILGPLTTRLVEQDELAPPHRLGYENQTYDRVPAASALRARDSGTSRRPEP